jgi:hypothetical protein
VKYKVKSQLYADAEARLKGTAQILDDCSWSSAAAAVSWASGYEVDYSAADGVAAFEKATGRKDKQGVSDAGGSLAEIAKTVAVLGGHARYAKSWDDAMQAAKAGAALCVWVQQPIGYPAGVHISKWHDGWAKWWAKKDPAHLKAGYGHMTSAGWCADHGWQWACPTRDEKNPSEQYAVAVTEAQLRQIANSKVKAGKVSDDYKCLLIVTYAKKAAGDSGAGSASVPVSAPTVSGVQTPTPPASNTPISATESAVTAKEAARPVEIDPALQKAVSGLEQVDWAEKAGEAAKAIGQAVESTKGQSGMSRIVGVIKAIKDSTGLDEALLEAARVFLSTCIAMMLATGSPLLDMSSGDFKVVISGGLAAALNVVVRFLNPNDSQFGVKKAGN